MAIPPSTAMHTFAFNRVCRYFIQVSFNFISAFFLEICTSTLVADERTSATDFHIKPLHPMDVPQPATDFRSKPLHPPDERTSACH